MAKKDYIGVGNTARALTKAYIGIPTAITEIDANTVVLLDGKTLNDISSNNISITNHGVSVSTTQSKFGGSSLYFNGSSYMELTSDKFFITNGDFTVDWWQYKENSGTLGCLNGWSGSNHSQFLIQYQGTILYSAYNAGAWGAIDNATGFKQETGAWIHWALVKSGTTVSTYRNGVKYWSGTVANSYVNGIGRFLLGRHANSGAPDYFKGYISHFRVSNVARWTSDFTVPTEDDYSVVVGEQEVARNIKKVYVGVNDKARLCWLDAYTFTWVGWNNATWADIYELCKAKQMGVITEWPSDVVLGATKTTTLSTTYLGMSSVSMVLIGIDIDGDGVLTFHGHALNNISNQQKYATSTTYSWDNSTVRTVCNNFYNYCDAKPYIKALTKISLAYSTYNEIQTTDYVWVPSWYEMGGKVSSSDVDLATGYTSKYNSEHTVGATSPYPYYANNVENRARKAGNYSAIYWLRSVQSTNAIFVSGTILSTRTKTNTNYITPAFAIG